MSTNEPPAGTPGEPVPPPAGDAAPPPPPPPPPAGDAAAPPPPPGAAAPVGSSSGWSIGDALNYGWTKFQANAAQFIIGGLILFVGLLVVGGISFGIQSALINGAECSTDSDGVFRCDDGSGFIASLFVSAIAGALFFIVAQIIGAGLIRGALGVTEGRPFQFGEVLKTDKLGPVVVTSLIIAGGTFVGILLCYLPGIIFAFVTQWSLYFVIDKGLAPVEAIKASFQLVKDNLTDTLIWYIVGGLVAGIGAIACGVGLLVTIPIALVGGAYTFKKLTGQTVAA